MTRPHDIQSFFDAAKMGDLDGIKECIDRHLMSVNDMDPCQDTLLNCACYHGSVEIVKFLLEQGADPNLVNMQERGPLTLLLGRAIHFKSRGTDSVIFDIAKRLIEAGADIHHQPRSHNFAPLHMAASSGSLEVVELLINSGASLYCVDDDGRTPLHMAISSDEQEVAKYLIAHMDDIESEAAEKGTPARYARDLGRLEILTMLAKKGARLDFPKRNNTQDIPCDRYIEEILKIREEKKIFTEIMRGSLRSAEAESESLDQKKGLRL